MRILLVALLVPSLLSGCTTVDRNTLTGATVGAGAGALIGLAGGPSGPAIGAAIGAGVGGAIGYLVRPDGCFVLNRRGEVWRVPCDGRTVRADACYMGNDVRGFRQVDCPAGRYR
jgi:hypothetical protein